MTKQISIPCNWFKHIIKPVPTKVDLLAINILAAIVGSQKEFVDGLLRKNQDDFAEIFNVSPSQARRAMRTLEEMGLITIHLLPYKIPGENLSVPKLMHISIDLERINALSN